eukprot:SAG11_NODE_582_length_8353_cov_28.953356_2_plen_128_part_00
MFLFLSWLVIVAIVVVFCDAATCVMLQHVTHEMLSGQNGEGGGGGVASVSLAKSAVEMWCDIDRTELQVCCNMPNVLYSFIFVSWRLLTNDDDCSFTVRTLRTRFCTPLPTTTLHCPRQGQQTALPL